MKSPTLPLATGQSIPQFGFGTFGLQGADCEKAVAHALEAGYRHLDTAAAYNNHKAVGRGLKNSGAAREEVFLTTKVTRDLLRRPDLINACGKALKELGTDYLDLFLVHWPNDDIPIQETIGAMETLVRDGSIRNYGVSNFTSWRLEETLPHAGIPPAVNQVEYHPYLNQEDLLAWCSEHHIVVTAYCPLAQGRVATDPLLGEIGKHHGKSAAQVALRWLLQKGIVAIPKATAKERIQSNFDVFDWNLTDTEMKRIDSIERRERLINWDVAGFDRAP